MRTWRKILLPLSWLYGAVILVRNKFYDWNWFSSRQFDLPVICIGNLRVGGTGKTPMTEYVADIIKDRYSTALLSRGYKRKSSGYLLAGPDVKVEDLGDEPYQFFRKFPDVAVAVDANRIEGIVRLREEVDPEVILLDDAFQHRKVTAGLNILLTVYGDLYVDDRVLPAGNLRDTRNQASRANIIVVTKCPSHLRETEMNDVCAHLDPLPGQEVYFATIDYDSYLHNKKGERLPLTAIPEGATLITGIASPGPLLHYLKSLDLDFKHQGYADHHNFAPHEIRVLEKNSFNFTTEKDFMRLEHQLEGLYYLPIKLRLLDREGQFQDGLLRFIESYKA